MDEKEIIKKLEKYNQPRLINILNKVDNKTIYGTSSRLANAMMLIT